MQRVKITSQFYSTSQTFDIVYHFSLELYLQQTNFVKRQIVNILGSARKKVNLNEQYKANSLLAYFTSNKLYLWQFLRLHYIKLGSKFRHFLSLKLIENDHLLMLTLIWYYNSLKNIRVTKK